MVAVTTELWAKFNESGDMAALSSPLLENVEEAIEEQALSLSINDSGCFRVLLSHFVLFRRDTINGLKCKFAEGSLHPRFSEDHLTESPRGTKLDAVEVDALADEALNRGAASWTSLFRPEDDRERAPFALSPYAHLLNLVFLLPWAEKKCDRPSMSCSLLGFLAKPPALAGGDGEAIEALATDLTALGKIFFTFTKDGDMGGFRKRARVGPGPDWMRLVLRWTAF